MKALNKNWTIIEQLIGLLLIVSGAVILYLLFSEMHANLNMYRIVAALSGEEFSYFELIKNVNLYILVPFAGIVGGVLLLYNKQFGWYLSCLASICSLILYTYITYRIVEASSGGLWIWITFSFLYSFVFGILFKQQILEKYTPNAKGMLIGLIVIIACVLDFGFIML